MSLAATVWSVIPRRVLLVIVGYLLMVAGCSSSTGEQVADADGTATSTTAVQTTTTSAPAPPELVMAGIARAEIGQEFTDAVVAVDPNGDDTAIEVTGRAPAGFSTIQNSRGRLTGFRWQPERAGQWDVELTATDTGGLSTTETIRLIARYPRPRDLLIAMGDSVAAGFGRDRSDFAGSDECFRSEGDSYARHTYDALVEAGSLAEDAELLIVACAGATAATLSSFAVTATTADGEVVGEPQSQLDAVIERNPTIVTLTVGATDVSMFDAAALTNPGAADDPDRAIDQFLVDNALRRLTTHLGLTLDALVRSTDAHVVVTTWYDPTAAIPIGVEGCTGECMVSVMANVVEATNDVIVAAVAAQPAGRVSLARLDGQADVWEAKNGLGPDVLRDGLGPLQGLVDAFTGGTTATCADEGSPPQDLISSLDCSHPNEAGHREIARVVTETLLDI